ncbi:apolipoprotein A1/A4/E family protein [Desulfobacter latus]|uniref:Apolipoprotein A1/A4/E family protein n=1 Tax=Desulfobacter latus TaxID=2292 RepID=A0A850T047_9BACT|nr:apolipoprotein A1/A4/E family protein [Desulfobacter latus]NWH06889.1 apolipoprotein A1/A4/E family protein [Desulfobacter latus]
MPNTELKERVTGLEQFMMELAYETTKTSMAVRQLSEEMKDFKNETRRDTKAFKEEMRKDTKALKEEMRNFKEEIRNDTKAFKEEMRNFKEEIRNDTKAFKEEMRNFKEEIRNDTKAFKEEMRNFKGEIQNDTKAFKEEMKNAKEETRKDTKNFKKELNKKWGELANKMGTIVEDIVAPGLKGVAAEYFGIKEFDFFAPRLRLKNTDRSITREFDVIAETSDYFFVVETKSTPSTGFISDFIKLIPQLDSWFPVIREKKLVPVFASLYISDDLITYLTRNNILAMATRGDGMDICNTEILKAFGVNA